jgi:hypothetical protein
LILGNEGVDVVPLGTLLTEIAPGLLIPVGMDLVPRVPEEVLTAALDHVSGGKSEIGGRVTVLLHDGTAFFVPSSELVPLERRVLARVPVPEADSLRDAYAAASPAAGRIVNDAVGRFALWGFQRADKK